MLFIGIVLAYVPALLLQFSFGWASFGILAIISAAICVGDFMLIEGQNCSSGCAESLIVSPLVFIGWFLSVVSFFSKEKSLAARSRNSGRKD